MPCPRTLGSTKRASICPPPISMKAIGRLLASTASHNGADGKNPHTISSIAIRSFGKRKSCVASTALRHISTTRSPSSGLEGRIITMTLLLAQSAEARYGADRSGGSQDPKRLRQRPGLNRDPHVIAADRRQEHGNVARLGPHLALAHHLPASSTTHTDGSFRGHSVDGTLNNAKGTNVYHSLLPGSYCGSLAWHMLAARWFANLAIGTGTDQARDK